MRPWLLCFLLAVTPAPVDAQSGDAPNLVFSVGLGLTSGRHLWTVDNQGMPGPSGVDSVTLGRRLRPGLTGTVGATLYRSPHFGWTAEIGYLGLGSEQRCDGPAVWKTDSQNINQQACERAQGAHRATSVVGFQFGAHFRFLATSRIQPYVRLTGGPGLIGNNYVQTSGAVIAAPNCTPSPCELRINDDADPKSLTWVITGTAGVTVSIAPAYRLRMEIRDIVTSLPTATGPAPLSPNGMFSPVERRMVHVPTFMFGLDLVFERRHTRRY